MSSPHPARRTSVRQAPSGRTVSVLALVVLLALFTTGCGEAELRSSEADPESVLSLESAPSGAEGTERPPPPDSRSLQVMDDQGQNVHLEGPARRVVSIIPSMTELVVALDAREALVARTRYDRDPSLAYLPSLGGTIRPNLEAIADLHPDLVIAWSDEEHSPLSRRLRDMGIPVYHASVQRIEDIHRHAQRLGHLLGRDAEATGFLSDLETRLTAVRETPHPGTPPTVLYIVWHDPPQTAGPGTFLDEIIEIAGGRNVFHDARSSWPQISMEEIVRRDPDVVVAATRHDGEPDDGGWLRRPGWQELTAVQGGRTLAVNADLFNRPGPGVAEAAEILHQYLAGVTEARAGGSELDEANRTEPGTVP